MFDSLSIEAARSQGAPDPEGNAERARSILAMILEKQFDAARKRLDEITDPCIREDLEILIEFDSTCCCIRG